jgi:poly(3-hydroxybutyrate) depolymerase
MLRSTRFLAVSLAVAWACLTLFTAHAAAAGKFGHGNHGSQQETGFLNRKIEVHGDTYRFQVYLPEEWRSDDHKQWPILLFLHGRGERGSEGLWQTQIGLPQAVRDHPERWPFIIVMPQCPLGSYWTDRAMLTMAMAALDQESQEFHADPDRTYLTGLSMGGYGAWELARLYPRRWAAVAIAAGGIFWSYAPERWEMAATLPAEYARAVGRTPLWLFHGSEDNVVVPRQSELLYDAIKANGGRIRLWIYQGLKHDCWTRAYNDPDLPHWLLTHHIDARTGLRPEQTAFAERQVIPLHPPAIKLTGAQFDSLSGDYSDVHGNLAVSLFRQGETLYERNPEGDVVELAAESSNSLFYPKGSSLTRLTVERDAQGRVIALLFRDDRHEERWEKQTQISSR